MTVRTYVVTGSASGIGAATAERLTGAGHRVVGVDLHDAEVIADLSTASGRDAMVHAVRAATGDVVDGVIACAGISSDDVVTVRINYFGAVATLEGLRPALERGSKPRAAAICSVAMIQANDDTIVDACLDGDEERAVAAAEGKGFLIYASTKRALARWVRRAAPTKEWAGAGIALNAIAPGVVLTPMTAPLLEDSTWRGIVEQSVPMPFGGHATAGDVASLLDWLTSEDNTRVTGQVVFVDGGADAVLRPGDVWPAAATDS